MGPRFLQGKKTVRWRTAETRGVTAGSRGVGKGVGDKKWKESHYIKRREMKNSDTEILLSAQQNRKYSKEE